MPTNSTQPVFDSDAFHAKQTLAAIRHFADLSDEILDNLIRRMTPCRFDTGNVLCLEGEPGEKIYILEKGWVKAVRTAVDGREQAAMLLRGGEFFGDEAVFTGATYPMTVIALENTKAWAIDGLVLTELVQRHPALAMAMIRHLGEGVLYYVQLVEDL
ncbi:MAG: cyclic nucleotide-binding domain-containing protein, partial [Chloroflexota bacterium]